MINLITRINGHIRHTDRLIQRYAQKVCSKLNISLLNPEPITFKNGWFTGFFDADGTITFSFKDGYPQLTISVSNKLKENINYFKDIFGGGIHFDKAGYGCFKWSIQSIIDIELFLEYLKIIPSQSHKRHRLFLVADFYALRQMKAYKSPSLLGGGGTELNKAWLAFEQNWKRINR